MKKFSIITLLILLLAGPGFAFELDLSVDEDIRKNYNSSKLENDVLPDLPPTLKNSSPTVQKNLSQTVKSQTDVPQPPKNSITTDFSGSNKVKGSVGTGSNIDSFCSIKVPKGTKFKVKSQTKVSDWNTAGARMTFTSVELVTKRYISFPPGTVFKGVIEESHQPNFGGNGGLLKLKADTLIVSGSMEHIDAKITKADGKNIYFNNIKGKRGYIKGVCKKVDKGQQFYNKSRNLSNKLASNPLGIVLSPIPTIVGAVGYGINLIASPVTGLWSKGSHITLPAGTNYTLKFRQDFYLNK